MLRALSTATLILLSTTASGCAICCSPFDCAYSAHGGSWERYDQFNGRVGSAFSPAGGPVMTLDNVEDTEELEQPYSIQEHDSFDEY